MRPVLLTALLAATGASIAPAAWAVPLLSMQYQIGSLSQTLEFMGDGSVRVCDGSVLVACDGSVLPVPGASFRTLGDGSVRELTDLLLLGDGSVRTGSELPSDMDGILLSALTFSPNPLLSASVNVVDFGAGTDFAITFSGLLALGGDSFDYTLSGNAELTDASGDGVSAADRSVFGLDGLLFGAVDLVGLAALGSGGLSSPGSHPFAPATGAASCIACAIQVLAISFGGSGGGDQFAFSSQLDIERAISAVPEPGTMGLLGLGLALLYARRRRIS
jgi:hypothetical protein